jgi:hypothetical protein
LAAILGGDYIRANKILSELYHRENEDIWYSVAYAKNLENLGREADAELVYRRLLDIFPGKATQTPPQPGSSAPFDTPPRWV